MECPYCGEPNTKVIDSRRGKIRTEVRRRRECIECSKRFTTFERIEDIPVMVIKKDDLREEFNRNKILSGIKKACEKRAISINQIEMLVEEIQRELREQNDKEVPSKLIGEKIMEKLHVLDDVAYVRFASVYRDFKDVDDFVQELKTIILHKEANQDNTKRSHQSNSQSDG
ncbi:MAG: transcriptional repressor NrdR [Desulfobacterales bacterium]|nr:transcriptional repressor NrdR [Desulfobacterales bacterium]